MLLSLRKNGLTSLFKEVRVLKVYIQHEHGNSQKWQKKKNHFGEFLFCGCLSLFEPSSSKRYENGGSMRFGVRQDHGEEQSKTLIGTKS